jgi:hypothetical protein
MTAQSRRFGNARHEGRRLYLAAMPTPVTSSCNLHTADCYGHPLGVRCRSCDRRVLVPLDRIGAQKGSMTLLQSLPLKCTDCGGREVELWLFAKRDEAETWADG